jgi:membrane associated rhomboid family serine protease
MLNDLETTTTCYRHPDRETGLACSNCDRPICADCVRPTPVGQRCPECVGSQRTLRPRSMARVTPVVSYAVIGICVAAFLVAGPRTALWFDGALFGPAVAAGEWWRVVTSMFLHGGLLHLLFNMYALYAFGPVLETRFGPLRYALVYLVGGLFGAAGALLTAPDRYTIGASGAIFGMLGALFMIEQRYGATAMSGVGGIIAINLVFTFLIPGISIGGHVGGLIGGAAAGYVIERAGTGRPVISPAALGALTVLALCAVGLIVVAV